MNQLEKIIKYLDQTGEGYSLKKAAKMCPVRKRVVLEAVLTRQGNDLWLFMDDDGRLKEQLGPTYSISKHGHGNSLHTWWVDHVNEEVVRETWRLEQIAAGPRSLPAWRLEAYSDYLAGKGITEARANLDHFNNAATARKRSKYKCRALKVIKDELGKECYNRCLMGG